MVDMDIIGRQMFWETQKCKLFRSATFCSKAMAVSVFWDFKKERILRDKVYFKNRFGANFKNVQRCFYAKLQLCAFCQKI